MRLRTRFLLLGILLFGAVVALGWPATIAACILDIVLVLVGCACLDIYRLEAADTLSVKALLIQYIVRWFTGLFGLWALKSFTNSSKDGKSQQEKLLLRILQKNLNTKYAKDHKFHHIKSISDFIKCCSLTRYSKYEPYFDQVIDNGDEDVLFPGKADFIALTSGTTSGKSKTFPKSTTNDRLTKALLMFILQRVIACHPGNEKLLRWHFIRALSKTLYTDLGVRKGSLSSMSVMHLPFFASPIVVNEITTEQDALYIHAVFGTRDKGVGFLIINFSTIALTFFKILEEKWIDACNDIENGTISTKINITQDIRLKINEALCKGDSERANELRSEFEKGFDNIIPRIWPECKFVSFLGTGHFRVAADTVKNKYAGNVPMVSLMHLGTEGFYGINMTPFEKFDEYTIFGPSNFFEFIPVDRMDEEQPPTLFAHQVKPNEDYEIVVTNAEGLYRYRTEDIIRITGFFGQYPTYKFLQRAGDVLNLYGEKLQEVLLSQAVRYVSKGWNLQDYTSVESTYFEKAAGEVSGRLFYIVFLEVGSSMLLAEKDGDLVDKQLRALTDDYDELRSDGMIECLKLIQLQPGTFSQLKKMMLENNPNCSIEQFKMPRIVRQDNVLTYLQGRQM